MKARGWREVFEGEESAEEGGKEMNRGLEAKGSWVGNEVCCVRSGGVDPGDRE